LGDVYLARHPRLPGHAALKVVSATTSEDRAFRARFARQAVLAMRISHPNIVGVQDVGEFEGRPWVAMDYVDGGDAGRLAGRHPGGMPEHEMCAIVTAVADALDYLHQAGYWHRCVKPTNILLTEAESSERRIFLSDFTTGHQLAETTADDLAVERFVYAAPEEFLDPPGDYRVDQYALAATAFHLCTGAAPYQGEDLAALVGQVITAAPPRLSERRPELSHLDQIFARALAKNPVDRFERCRDFAVELARASRGSGQTSH
jgi:serine/threonine protein kinase, bacterial